MAVFPAVILAVGWAYVSSRLGWPLTTAYVAITLFLLATMYGMAAENYRQGEALEMAVTTAFGLIFLCAQLSMLLQAY